MVHHLVWLRARPGVTDERMSDLLEDVRALAGVIPGVVAVNVGSNFTDRAMGYSHAAVVVLESREALEPYLTHSEHLAVGERLREFCEVLALDFEDLA